MRSGSKVQQFRVADLMPIGLAVRGGVPYATSPIRPGSKPGRQKSNREGNHHDHAP
jgi:hypothetical protein